MSWLFVIVDLYMQYIWKLSKRYSLVIEGKYFWPVNTLNRVHSIWPWELCLINPLAFTRYLARSQTPTLKHRSFEFCIHLWSQDLLGFTTRTPAAYNHNSFPRTLAWYLQWSNKNKYIQNDKPLFAAISLTLGIKGCEIFFGVGKPKLLLHQICQVRLSWCNFWLANGVA